MRAPKPYNIAAMFDEPTGVNIGVVQADEDGRRIERGMGVAAGNSLKREWITMRQRLRHPGIRRGKACRIEKLLPGKRFDHWGIVERVARIG